MIRTLAEIRQGRITIQEVRDNTTIAVSIDGATSRDRENLITELDVAVGTLKVREDQVVLLKAQVDELVRQRENLITELDRALEQVQATEPISRPVWQILLAAEDRVADAELQRDRYVSDLNTFKRLAYEQNERAAGERRRASELEDRLSAVREFLTAGAVAEARETIVTSRGAILADAIANALRVLD